MSARDRRDQVTKLVDRLGSIRTESAAAELGVSSVTLRKDLTALESEGRLLRVRGGAVSAAWDQPEPPFDVRQRQQRHEKQAIASMAAGLVRDGEAIALDASTTALFVARALRSRDAWRRLTVVTNGLAVAAELAGCDGVTVLMLAGRVRGPALSVVDHERAPVLKPQSLHRAFVGAAGFTLDRGLADATHAEAATKRGLVEAAVEVVAIADHTKLGRRAVAPFCPTARIGMLLTDAGARPAFLDQLRGRGIVVRVGHEQTDA